MDQPTSHSVFTLNLQVKASDIDEMGHVNNVNYLKWVQEAAVAHWNAGATAAQKEGVLWVVTRHEIDYQRPVMEGDTVQLTTWVGKLQRRGFERYTEIHRQSDGKRCAKVLSLWAPVDPITMKGIKPGPDLIEMWSKPSE